jgi:hypothetical protein
MLSTGSKLSEPWLLIRTIKRSANMLSPCSRLCTFAKADAAVRSAKHMVEAAVAVISHELGPAETQRFLHVVGVAQAEESVH